MERFKDHYGVLALASTLPVGQVSLIPWLNSMSIKKRIDKFTQNPVFYQAMCFNQALEPLDLIYENLREAEFL